MPSKKTKISNYNCKNYNYKDRVIFKKQSIMKEFQGEIVDIQSDKQLIYTIVVDSKNHPQFSEKQLCAFGGFKLQQAAKFVFTASHQEIIGKI